MEIVIPILFIVFLVAIRQLVNIDVFEEQSFISNPAYTSTIYGQKSTALANNSTLVLKQFNGTNTGCRPGMVVGLSPSGNTLVSTLNTQLAGLGYTTEIFASESAITSRVRSPEYGSSLPKLCFGITVDQAAIGGAYSYRLHFN